jgi:hypothetical protein
MLHILAQIFFQPVVSKNYGVHYWFDRIFEAKGLIFMPLDGGILGQRRSTEIHQEML